MTAGGLRDHFDRIVVVVTRQIGDVLLTTPLIHAAKQRWPNARIDVLGFAGTLGMLRGNPDIGELIEVKPGSSWRQSWPLIRRLWRKYDLALVAQYTDRAHLYGWVTAGVRSGQVPEGREGRWKRRLLHHVVSLGDRQSHVVLEKMRLLAPWMDPSTVPWVQAPPASPIPDDLASQLRPGYVVLQVPSLVHYKQWPLRHGIELVRALAQRGHLVVLTGGPSAEDRSKVARVLQEARAEGVVDACGRLDFNQLAGLLVRASLYIGPDTSVTHLAAACGVPVIALFGPIDPRWWGPWPNGWPAEQPYQRSAGRQQRGTVVLLQGPQRCVPCNAAGCDRHLNSRSECLETMGSQRVLDEALAVLEKA